MQNVCFPAKADVHNNDLVVIWRLSVLRIANSDLYFDRYIFGTQQENEANSITDKERQVK